MVDETTLQIVKGVQLHHARLLYLITDLYQKGLILEDQKLALKFGVLNDDPVLMEFYYRLVNNQHESPQSYSKFE